MDIKDIQINILANTIAQLNKENSELRAGLIVLQQQKESVNTKHEDNAINENTKEI